MSGSPVIGESLTDTLGGPNARFISSDGNEGTLPSQYLLSELQEQGLAIKSNQPSTTTAAFNAKVCDVQPLAQALETPAMQPKPDIKMDGMGLGS